MTANQPHHLPAVRCPSCGHPLGDSNGTICAGCGRTIDPVALAVAAVEEWRFRRASRWTGAVLMGLALVAGLWFSIDTWRHFHPGQPPGPWSILFPVFAAPFMLWPILLAVLPAWWILVRTGRRVRQWPVMAAGWLVLAGYWLLATVLALGRMYD